MAKVRRSLNSHLIKRINTTIRRGNYVLLGTGDPSIAPYVAKILEIESIGTKNNRKVEVQIRWYYRPEDTKGGRQTFHGTNEVFISDHFDTQCVDTIVGKCTMHDFYRYTKRRTVVDNKDFFCRFKYFPITDEFFPAKVEVYCQCEMPDNPDVLMIQCEDEECNEWYHPACINMSVEEARQLEHFICDNCLAKRTGVPQN